MEEEKRLLDAWCALEQPSISREELVRRQRDGDERFTERMVNMVGAERRHLCALGVG